MIIITLSSRSDGTKTVGHNPRLGFQHTILSTIMPLPVLLPLQLRPESTRDGCIIDNTAQVIGSTKKKTVTVLQFLVVALYVHIIAVAIGPSVHSQ